MNAQHIGNIFIISAASGTGKTTLVSRLTHHYDTIRVAVSHTTRPPREGEQHGKQYYFVSPEKFMQLVGDGVFLEHAQVFGNYYGTSMLEVRELINKGVDVILEIDVQGATQIRQALPNAISIFILPPSLAVLEERLRKRKTDSEDVIVRRLNEARHEIQQAIEFDYIVVNNDLVETENHLLSIIRSQRFRQPLQMETIEKILKNQ
ncbi:guanylate kinase [Simonsiella muelleri]|uniref:Guanylate kinase n=1 Tax=Simonsiella muelleri ATCC 29453 TaxID=641147 RepID=V9HMB6_9NEIS|nr:guanylate kinase [Simonsiella muelleri]AUX61216.1 guanylate kinase [Simonsiella muelleri ATCC 29453]EFG31041.1 guanylate kinase [Simonsiella muelleri ATCC 29453]UBQ53271.1 guanylate kinase [Simonsiella muelleri]